MWSVCVVCCRSAADSRVPHQRINCFLFKQFSPVRRVAQWYRTMLYQIQLCLVVQARTKMRRTLSSRGEIADIRYRFLVLVARQASDKAEAGRWFSLWLTISLVCCLCAWHWQWGSDYANTTQGRNNSRPVYQNSKNHILHPNRIHVGKYGFKFNKQRYLMFHRGIWDLIKVWAHSHNTKFLKIQFVHNDYKRDTRVCKLPGYEKCKTQATGQQLLAAGQLTFTEELGWAVVSLW